MWMTNIFQTTKPVIALLHIRALPGDPYYGGSMQEVIDTAGKELTLLQESGVDGILFSNEFSLPYELQVNHVTTAAVARVIGALQSTISVPFGVNIVRNPMASIEVAAATDATFVRSTFTGAYAGEMGIMNTDVSACIRRKHALGRPDLKLLYKINPESDAYLVQRDLRKITNSVVFNCNPDALCVSGPGAGKPTDTEMLGVVKGCVPDTPVLCNTGCTADNITHILDACDGACVGTTFKKGGAFTATVDKSRVEAFMQKVQAYRATEK